MSYECFFIQDLQPNLCVSHCCFIEVDEAHRLFFRFCQQWSWDLVFFPPKNKKWQRFVMKLAKPGMYQPEWNQSNLNVKYSTQNITQLEIYSGPHVKVLVDFCGGHVIFWPPSRGKDAIYRYPGSPCYGLLRKRQNGGRPEAQEGPKDTTSCAMWILKHFVYKNG